MLDPRDYREIPDNPHGIRAGSILLPTRTPIVLGGGTSLDFVLEQGGDEDTFILVLGMRRVGGVALDILEGVFLTPDGPGFRPTWDFAQLMREASHGGWRVVATEEVLRDWAPKVDERMNKA